MTNEELADLEFKRDMGCLTAMFVFILKWLFRIPILSWKSNLGGKIGFILGCVFCAVGTILAWVEGGNPGRPDNIWYLIFFIFIVVYFAGAVGAVIGGIVKGIIRLFSR